MTNYFTATPETVETRFPDMNEYHRKQLEKAREGQRLVRVEVAQFMTAMYLWGIEIL